MFTFAEAWLLDCYLARLKSYSPSLESCGRLVTQTAIAKDYGFVIFVDCNRFPVNAQVYVHKLNLQGRLTGALKSACFSW